MPTFDEQRVKYWLRPDAQRFQRPDWRRFWKAGYENDQLYQLNERIERKFSADQPRVPAGSSGGGQWTGGSVVESSTTNSGTRSIDGSGSQTKIAAKISAKREQECELMHRQDLFICKAFRSKACYTQAYLRYTNCLFGRQIPPLNF